MITGVHVHDVQTFVFQDSTRDQSSEMAHKFNPEADGNSEFKTQCQRLKIFLGFILKF